MQDIGREFEDAVALARAREQHAFRLRIPVFALEGRVRRGRRYGAVCLCGWTGAWCQGRNAAEADGREHVLAAVALERPRE